MYFVKHCQNEHNITSGKASIKLGTLEEYRTAEIGGDKDHEEGRFRYTIEFQQPTWISIGWFRAITGVAINEKPPNAPKKIANVQADITNFKCIKIEPERVRATGEIILNFKYPNCYVLSMSYQSKLDHNQKLTEYGDFWYFEEQDWNAIYSIFRKLAEIVIKETDFWEPHYSVFGRNMMVNYLDRNLVFEDEEKHSVENLNSLFWDSVFIKEPKFALEREFRMMLEVRNNGFAIDVPDKPIFVNPALLLGWIKSR